MITTTIFLLCIGTVLATICLGCGWRGYFIEDLLILFKVWFLLVVPAIFIGFYLGYWYSASESLACLWG